MSKTLVDDGIRADVLREVRPVRPRNWLARALGLGDAPPQSLGLGRNFDFLGAHAALTCIERKTSGME